MKAYILNAFTKDGEGGNPAGIVLDADSLSENEMQTIAANLGFSETAFVQKSENADFKVRFFTPNMEVDLCGHATIATFYLLLEKGIIKQGEYTQETKAGKLKIKIQDKNVLMNQTLPIYSEKLEKKEIAESLNINEKDFSDVSPIQIVSTGLRDILIPIKKLEVLEKINPNFEKITEISKQHNCVGFHIFNLESKGTARVRNFGPLYGIPEESATGTSNGALACYLFEYKLIDNFDNLIFEQGYSMNKPSEILASLIIKDGKITEVKIGGTANLVEEKELINY